MRHTLRLLNASLLLSLITILNPGDGRAGEFQTDSLKVKLPKNWEARVKVKVILADPVYNADTGRSYLKNPMAAIKPAYSNMPEHVQIDLSPMFPDGYVPAEITLHSVDAFSRIYDPEGKPAKEIIDDFHELWTIVSQPKTYHQGTPLPFMPFLEGTQSVVVGFKSIPFTEGFGVRFLTQFDIESTLLHEGGLLYIYEGLTKDRKYYVLATFPVQLEGLSSAKVKEHLGFSMEQGRYGELEKNIDTYHQKASAWLQERLDQITPSLKELDEIMASIEVKRTQH